MFPIIPALAAGFATVPRDGSEDVGALWFNGYAATQFDENGHWVEDHTDPIALWRIRLRRPVIGDRAYDLLRPLLVERGHGLLLREIEDGQVSTYDLLTGSEGGGIPLPAELVSSCRAQLRRDYCAALLHVAIQNYEELALVPLDDGLCYPCYRVARHEVRWW
jgi:hypothetical protein